MEGTRHEKASIVGISYFIGALTAFIGLGFNQADLLVSNVGGVQVQSASVISAVEKTEVPETVSNAINYHNGVLRANNVYGEIIISYNPVVSGLEASPEFVAQGIHIDKLVYRIAKGDTSVFFCEQKDQNSAACSPFIYDVLNNAVSPLIVNGSALVMTTDQARGVSFNGTDLQVPGYIAGNQLTPWLLSS